MADAETQTDMDPLQSPSAKKRRLKKPAGNTLPKAFLKRVIRYIQQIYKDKILADDVDDKRDNKRQTMPTSL